MKIYQLDRLKSGYDYENSENFVSDFGLLDTVFV